MFWLTYAVTCALLHHILALHYQDSCKPSWWWSLGFDPSAYCGFLHKTLHVLRAGPLVAVLPIIPGLPRLPGVPRQE